MAGYAIGHTLGKNIPLAPHHFQYVAFNYAYKENFYNYKDNILYYELIVKVKIIFFTIGFIVNDTPFKFMTANFKNLQLNMIAPL